MPKTEPKSFQFKKYTLKELLEKAEHLEQELHPQGVWWKRFEDGEFAIIFDPALVAQTLSDFFPKFSEELDRENQAHGLSPEESKANYEACREWLVQEGVRAYHENIEKLVIRAVYNIHRTLADFAILAIAEKLPNKDQFPDKTQIANHNSQGFAAAMKHFVWGVKQGPDPEVARFLEACKVAREEAIKKVGSPEKITQQTFVDCLVPTDEDENALETFKKKLQRYKKFGVTWQGIKNGTVFDLNIRT